MEIRVKGFEPFNASGIRADVDWVVNLRVNFQVAGTSATTLVNAAAATVDVSSTVGNLISSDQAVDLPLNAVSNSHRQPIPGQFGNEGRKAIRGPGLVSADLSIFKNFALIEKCRPCRRAFSNSR